MELLLDIVEFDEMDLLLCLEMLSCKGNMKIGSSRLMKDGREKQLNNMICSVKKMYEERGKKKVEEGRRSRPLNTYGRLLIQLR